MLVLSPGWILAVTLLVVGGCGRAPQEGAPDVEILTDGTRSIAGCPSLPVDNALNVPVTELPVRQDSAERMSWLAENAGGPLSAGACSYVWEGSRCGLPITVAGADSRWRTVHFAGPYVWGQADFPLPVDYRIEGEPNPSGAWDRHVLVVDRSTCILHELINVRDGLLGVYADGGARWDLRGNGYATEVWASAEAAELPMVPLIYTYEEVEAGVIPHALRIMLPWIADAYEWPARHTDGRSDDPVAPPMGAWLRLRADVDLERLGPQARVIANALQDHGAIVADTTLSEWHLSGTPDARWDDDDLDALGSLTPNDFEWLDVSGRGADGSGLSAADATGP
jgi:hypothetical protein